LYVQVEQHGGILWKKYTSLTDTQTGMGFWQRF